VIAVGRTSLSVDVQLWREALLSGERKLATSGKFIMVARPQLVTTDA
jgi:acyl-CoA hydrolase